MTAQVTKFTSAFTATMANLVTKTINIFKHNIKMDLRRNIAESWGTVVNCKETGISKDGNEQGVP